MPVATKVREIMHSRIVSVKSDQTVWDAAFLMDANKIGSVLVGEGDAFVGIITERDVLRKVTLQGRDARSTKASEVMSSPLVTIEADRGLGEAALLMLDKKLRRLPVVDKGRIVGIITERDVNRATTDAIMSLVNVG